MDEAGLWTDGRYFVQAAAQLKDTTVKLFKIGEEGVPTVDEYIKDTLSDGGVIGFDGRVVNAAWGKRLSEIAKEKHGSMYVNEDLIDLEQDQVSFFHFSLFFSLIISIKVVQNFLRRRRNRKFVVTNLAGDF